MVLDILSAVIITYGFYLGYSRGLIKTVVDTLAIFIAFVVAMQFGPVVITYLQDILKFNVGVEFLIGFLFTFFLTLLLLKFIGDKIEDIFKAIGINFINQILGGVLLGLVFAVIVGTLLATATNFRIISDTALAESRLYGHLMDINEHSSGILQTFKSIFTDFWNVFMDTVEQVKEKTKE